MVLGNFQRITFKIRHRDVKTGTFLNTIKYTLYPEITAVKPRIIETIEIDDRKCKPLATAVQIPNINRYSANDWRLQKRNSYLYAVRFSLIERPNYAIRSRIFGLATLSNLKTRKKSRDFSYQKHQKQQQQPSEEVIDLRKIFVADGIYF